MTNFKALAVAMALACTTLPAAAQQITQIAQDNSFSDANLRWTGANAKGYDARVALKNIGGKLALCGVGVVTNSQLNSAIRSALRGGTIKVNGKTVLKDFTFFAKAKRAKTLKATPANCKVSSAPAPKRSDTLDFSYGNGTFRN